MLLVQVHSCVLTRSKHAAVAAAAVAGWRRRQVGGGAARQGGGSSGGCSGGGDRHQHIQLELLHDVVILFQDFFFIFVPSLAPS